MPHTLSWNSLMNKFWSKVDKGDGKDPCWIWTGIGTESHGDYGTFVHARKKIFAHRFSYELAHGKIPDGFRVLHKCDTPRCVNPNHLFLGTMSDNAHDMVNKGRHGSKTHPERFERGSRHHAAKLTEDDIAKIKNLREAGVYQKDIAKLFGVSQSVISNIETGTTWAHVK